ncbi:perilipin-2 isoform X2 [Microcaecilia unicolor]|uniref:Perilipin n=1 Tax=Microcaecilia unicolor TaxID=1415580 RepID=A0A6P7XHB2_9AMPH|nr:perilipin-2-like isoform X2 [Microcaecilia unicolor]
MTSVTNKQNVVVRVVNLPLVSSTCAMVSSAYSSTKENHLYLKSACEVAEKGVKSITAAALTSAKPIIQKLEPQIAVANNYACIGLDKMEKKLPILYQPTEKVVANAIGLVLGAKETVAGTVTQAKDAAAHMITGVVAKTKGAVQESIETTKAAVSGSINAVQGSRMMQMVSTGVDAALTKSEALVDQYFPLSDEAESARFEAGTQEQSYYIRLKTLSSKVQKSAYEKVSNKINDVITLLHHTIDLTSESRILIGVRDLTHQLRATSFALVSRIQDLPQNIQAQICQAYIMAGNIYQNVHTTTQGQLKKIELHVEDYFGNVPFFWLMGPFYPQLQEYREEEETSQQDLSEY